MGQKVRAAVSAVPLSVGRADPSSRLVTIDMDQRGRGLLCPSRRGAGSPSNTMWSGSRPTSNRAKFHVDPSNRLATIHQRYRQTDRQTDRTRGKLFDSIERTVLQTVAQKSLNRRQFVERLRGDRQNCCLPTITSLALEHVDMGIDTPLT